MEEQTEKQKKLTPVYATPSPTARSARWTRALSLALALAVAGPGLAWSKGEAIHEAQAAFKARDQKRLAALASAAIDTQDPLAPWIHYWALNSRLGQAQQSELDAFYARWRGSYVEDRLRNDWLLELGHRRDWGNFARDYKQFRMRDDREVACYALLTEALNGQDVRAAARAAWLGQREADTGCNLLAEHQHKAGRLSDADVWLKIRFAVENGRLRTARQAVMLLSREAERGLGEALDKPDRFLKAKNRKASNRTQAELIGVALLRVAASDHDSAASQLRARWQAELPPDLAAWIWAQLGRQSAMRLHGEASELYDKALILQGRTAPEWSDDTLAWAARAALRANAGGGHWALVLRAIELMSDSARQDATWQYWRARALMATSAQRHGAEAQRILQGIASPMSFYGKLAADDLGQTLPLPPAPAPLTSAERTAASANPGLQRALMMIDKGLRSEGVREWNFSLRGMSDRELLAAAQLACDREVWDRCISASERTRQEIDLTQRFPTPHRDAVLAQAREYGLDAAYVYGLIRQESRFVTDARSSVGAAGLMQVMPATAKWTAKKAGIADFQTSQLHERDVNLRIGTRYLKLVLDDFEGSMAMAAAAYNAGPGRPRRWRDGPALDAAVWAENIPFSETRDYVKRVLSNTTIYAQLLGGAAEQPGLRQRLGARIGPRAASGAPAINTELP